MLHMRNINERNIVLGRVCFIILDLLPTNIYKEFSKMYRKFQEIATYGGQKQNLK